MDDQNKRTIRRQSGRILLLFPTAVAVLMATMASLVMEWYTGSANYMMVFQLFLFVIGLLLLMLPGLIWSAFCEKVVCTMDETGIRYKGRYIPWTSIRHMEYVYGYTRYYGDHSHVKVVVGYENIKLPRAPIWLPLYAKRFAPEMTVSLPHLKRHVKRGVVIGLFPAAIVVCLYLL